MRDKLIRIYTLLHERFGPMGWWPAETPFEVVIGAILTQNTSWKNVEKAIENLKALGPLTPRMLLDLPEKDLQEAIRPSGYFRLKAGRLRNFLRMLEEGYSGRIESLFDLPTDHLREVLLGVSGIGPETADSILLYAAERPVFVIDAYTIRIFCRHRLLPEETTYAEAQEWVMGHLPADVRLFNEYHALLVAAGKTYCRPRPRCEGCPLEGFE